MNLEDWLDTWFALYVVPAQLAPSTVAMYRRSVNAVPSWLSRQALETLSPVEVQRWLVTVARNTPRAAQLDRTMITRAIKVARKSGLCSCVLDEDTLPRIKHTTATAAILTPEEARRYLAATQQVPGYPLLLLMLVCGLRRGEALGLRWTDIDAQGVLHVQRQRQRVNHAYTARKLKSAASNRALQLPPGVLEILHTQPRSLSWVCDTTPEHLNRDHHAALRLAQITTPVTLHGLRHTMATLAALDGTSMKLLQAALGHSTYTLTADLYAAHTQATTSSAPALVWQGLAVV